MPKFARLMPAFALAVSFVVPAAAENPAAGKRPAPVQLEVPVLRIGDPNQAQEDEGFTQEQIDALNEVLRRAKKMHVTPVDQQKAFYDALKGILGGLDPHSTFMTPDEFKQLQTQTAGGNFGGIGLELEGKKPLGRHMKVIVPIPGGPAFRARSRDGDKISGGDEIKTVDGEDTKFMEGDSVVEKIRGPIGRPVTLGIMRNENGVVREFSVTMLRETITMPDVASGWADEGAKIGYLYLSSFDEHSYAHVVQELDKLKKAGMRSLVFDLRGDPGGLLDQVGPITALFLERGKRVVSAVGRGSDDVYYQYPASVWDLRREAGTYKDLPIAVLIDGRSASASEIFAGAIKDHKRGPVVGTRSFGKTTVQTVIPVDGRRGNPDPKKFPALKGAGFKVTTAEFHTPSGKPIPSDGLDPTHEVPVDEPTANRLAEQIKGRLYQIEGMETIPDPVIEKAVKLLKVR